MGIVANDVYNGYKDKKNYKFALSIMDMKDKIRKIG
jgi:hypothetical protein